jgi:hypothetical protein
VPFETVDCSTRLMIFLCFSQDKVNCVTALLGARILFEPFSYCDCGHIVRGVYLRPKACHAKSIHHGCTTDNVYE